MDFFNIMVQKEKGEKNGIELFISDPLFYGTYAARLSHSCDPNCWAVPVIRDGKYTIAMLAIKDIKY